MNQETMKRTIKPLENRVVLKRTKKEETLRGGIVLPDSAKKKPDSATVIAVGPGKRIDGSQERLPMSVQVGQTVLVDEYAIREIEGNDGEELLIVKEDDIIAVYAD